MTMQFFRLVAEAPPPVRADNAALGTMPTRAYRHCEAMRQASSLGWYVYPPRSCALLWDGQDVHVSLDDGPFQPGGIDAMPFPGLDTQFDDAAPADLSGTAPPWITVLPEPGTVQIWSGYCAKTEPGWSLLVRAPANLPRAGNYQAFEGVVDTDAWFGPLFVNLRLTRTGVPVRLNTDWPIAMVVPVFRSVTMPALARAEITDLPDIQLPDWSAYRDAFSQRTKGTRRGSYAVQARKRAAQLKECSHVS